MILFFQKLLKLFSPTHVTDKEDRSAHAFRFEYQPLANVHDWGSVGLADDLLTTVCLATTAPVMVAPAMNQQMWAHPAVQINVKVLDKVKTLDSILSSKLSLGAWQEIFVDDASNILSQYSIEDWLSLHHLVQRSDENKLDEEWIGRLIDVIGEIEYKAEQAEISKIAIDLLCTILQSHDDRVLQLLALDAIYFYKIENPDSGYTFTSAQNAIIKQALSGSNTSSDVSKVVINRTKKLLDE